MALHIGRWILDAGWLFILFILLHHFWNDRKALVLAQSWLKVSGHITQCEWTQVGHSVWPKILYTYQVMDQELTGIHLFLNTSYRSPNSRYSRSIAYKVAIAYNEKHAIDIYYNPNHPDQSALDVTIPKKLNIILILIILLIILQLGTIIARFI